MYEELVQKIADARKEINSARSRMLAAEYELRERLADQYNVSAFSLILGTWPCPDSPTKFCIYNSLEDPCHDDCIICHDPEERK